ncbi:hypothetical protein CLO_3190 [Clostridium botulinum E1 str. 'BoNT E Beluga']|nr:hypothetical protein CLO_3190 [Clostridium botulinum E1 str. 'BoNT E Beluga']
MLYKIGKIKSLFYKAYFFIQEKMNSIINIGKYMAIPRSEVTIWYNGDVLNLKEK